MLLAHISGEIQEILAIEGVRRHLGKNRAVLSSR